MIFQIKTNGLGLCFSYEALEHQLDELHVVPFFPPFL
jgi:hypothetical protein